MQVIHQTSSTEEETLELKGLENEELIEYLSGELNGDDLQRKIILSVDNRFSIDNLPKLGENSSRYTSIINIRRANDIGELVSFFSSVNEKLELGGKFVMCFEPSGYRRERIMRKFPSGINKLYYCFDFFGKRVAPKLPILKKGYFFLTAGRNRVYTTVEVLGRLVYCGFAIIDSKKINNHLYVIAKKVEQKKDVKPKDYGFLFSLQRNGYLGKPIKVYKIRTMFAYSEYLQEYVYEKNKLGLGGKFNNDFRVNYLGKYLRKLWLDELPMLYNWLKGDLKLVGVRPLSNQYLGLYSDLVKERRAKFKPGLVPPYYADMPKTIEEIMESEMKYFDAYEKSALTTDLNYFMKAGMNILFKKARSK